MDPNEYVKGLIAAYATKVQQGLGMASQAAQRGLGLVAEDASKGAAVLNDPRNAWIGTNPVGRVGAGGLELLAKGLGGLGLAGMTVYHGSPHVFDKFSLSKIGTGEGAQAYGHGLYFAENPAVAWSYRQTGQKPLPSWATPETVNLARNALSQMGGDKAKALALLERQAAMMPVGNRESIRNAIQHFDSITTEGAIGNLYRVDLPDEAANKMLEWDKPLSEQPWQVQRALEDSGLLGELQAQYKGAMLDPRKMTGAEFYRGLAETEAEATARLRAAGIPGLKYLDAISRGTGEKGATYNYVVFDDSLPTIKKRE